MPKSDTTKESASKSNPISILPINKVIFYQKRFSLNLPPTFSASLKIFGHPFHPT
jgi:hypothetical protein